MFDVPEVETAFWPLSHRSSVDQLAVFLRYINLVEVVTPPLAVSTQSKVERGARRSIAKFRQMRRSMTVLIRSQIK